MKRGVVERDVDISKVSGTGSVATFVINDDGRTVVFWPDGHSYFPSLEKAIEIHGHNGNTRFVILDDPDIVPHCDGCHQIGQSLPCGRHDFGCPGCLETVG